MSALLSSARRSFLTHTLQSVGVLTIGFQLPSVHAQIPLATRSTLDVNEVDGYFSIHADGRITLYCGKVDLGQGIRIAIPQMAAEELGIDVAKIQMIDGDTALTPDQGPTAGSSGIMRGGVQIRQAAATARQALIAVAATQMNVPIDSLDAIDGEVRPIVGGKGIAFQNLIGNQQFKLKIDSKAKLRNPNTYRYVGKGLPRPDVPAKVTGTHVYMQDFSLPGMLHARVIRPQSVGSRIISVDESSIKRIGKARIVRIEDFLAVVAEDEWDAQRASVALKVQWSLEKNLLGHAGVKDWLRKGPFESTQTIMKKGDVQQGLSQSTQKIQASYYWPVQSHASMGPSCAVADLSDGQQAVVWSASQATHRLRGIIARLMAIPNDKVRVIYLDGAGCYGMNGHDDASLDAALISKAIGKPVRVQWTRQDENIWDPKGPPQLIDIEGGVSADGKIAAWKTVMFIPKATAQLPNIPLLGPQSAGIKQLMGISTGLISQNGNPPYSTPHVEVSANWHKDAPLRPSNIRAPGKIANCFAVESFTDELSHLAGVDPLEFRLQGMSDARGIEIIQRTSKLIGWKKRNTPVTKRSGTQLKGRGMAYMHYKGNETYVGVAMDVVVNTQTGVIQVKRIACAHDCGLIINPDGTQAQVEGNLLQTLSRTLHEEVKFDKSQVTSSNWATYPILTFPQVPEILIDLIDRPFEPPLGAGEAAATPIPAALANAVFDACGVRMRTAPFTPAQFKIDWSTI
ncbi:MAG: xanthine dehydrogenase family protein molybdopterin-binding subunit [Betaproteobacteria bacterium]|nr:xanthine dehydrogenase family protein molybdopterin-binding subunit [Betaproteobacteria bacterium]